MLPILPPDLYQICIFLVTTKKLSSDLESHGEVMEKYFVKSVGTLIY